MVAGDVDLDLADVTFLDSSGLAVLLAARQGLHEKHHRMRVQNPSKPVVRVFELSGVLDVLMNGSQPKGDSGRAAAGEHGLPPRRAFVAVGSQPHRSLSAARHPKAARQGRRETQVSTARFRPCASEPLWWSHGRARSTS
jgi:hypothetical protein